MQRVAVINSILICTTFANTNIYNSSNGWIPLRLTEQSSKLKTVLKEATEFSNSLFKPFESREEVSNETKLVMPQVKMSPQSNKIFFLQPDTKESSGFFASGSPTVQASTPDATEVEMTDNILKKEIDSSLENQNITIGDPSKNKQCQLCDDNKFDSDLHNFYEKVIITRVTTTEPASIENFFKEKKKWDFETSTILYIDNTQDYAGNGNGIRKPVVVPISPRNEVNSKIINLLMKYNSKSLPMLNNDPVTKTNFNDYTTLFNLYRPQKPSLIAIPFRYNILNHLPVNPLLAVFISNYGYSLQDSESGSQVSKKLYGYSNNVHNHYNPFRSEEDPEV